MSSRLDEIKARRAHTTLLDCGTTYLGEKGIAVIYEKESPYKRVATMENLYDMNRADFIANAPSDIDYLLTLLDAPPIGVAFNVQGCAMAISRYLDECVSSHHARSLDRIEVILCDFLAMSEQPPPIVDAEQLSERVDGAIKQLRQSQERGIDFQNDDLVKLLRDLLAALTAQRVAGEQAGLRRAAKLMCQFCRQTEIYKPAVLVEGSMRLWHLRHDGKESQHYQCEAAAILAEAGKQPACVFCGQPPAQSICNSCLEVVRSIVSPVESNATDL